jgi:methyl-accepting chemotaxis protein
MSTSSASSSSTLARIIFWPVYFFIERVRFARSFLLIFLLLPDFYVAYLLVQQTTNSVEFSRKESMGVAYITPAREFLADVQRLRVASALPGALGSAEQVRLMAHGDELLAAVDAADQSYGADLGTSATWKQAKGLWSGVKTAALVDPAARDAQIAKLTALLVSELIINKAGNNSNLILDPDLDSYWMMDAYVFKLPAMGELATSAGSGAIQAFSDGQLSPSERLDLAATLGLLSSTTNDLIAIDLKTALEDNEQYSASEGREGNRRLRPALEKPFKELAAEVDGYVAYLRAPLLEATSTAMDMSHLAAISTNLVNQIALLNAKVGPELDRLCVERADRFRHTRLVGIITFLIAAILISYVFNGFTSSVRAQQQKIVDENRSLQGDILSLLRVVSAAADGDLTARAQVGEGTLGNIADAFNQMMESWQELVAAINKQLDRTTAAVTQLRQSAGTMAAGASRQATEVVAATTSVQRMSDEIGRVSGNAETAVAAAQRTQASAQQGADSVQNVISGMDSLRVLVQAGAKKIKILGDRSMEINSIVGTIAKISEQTNMLALNAAIEAARAGEQGRGFSVVADEVRKLAERTATATQEIDKLVRNIQVETTESVAAIERQTLVVEEEGRAVSAAGDALARIEETTSQSANLVTDIAGIARTQVDGAQHVVGTMQRISTIAQETEGTAQSSLVIAQTLGELSQELRTSMGRFKVS